MSSMNRREFLQILAAASAAGFALDARSVAGPAARATAFYDLPKFGNVHLLHFTDCHAQLLPVYFREPSVNLGIGGAQGKAPHLVGEHLLKAFGIKPGSIEAHAFTYLNFEQAARPTARSAASPTSPRWSSACARDARARCCSTAATPGRARPPPCGPRARTWSMPASCSASTS
jgi:hypothetical protein